MPKTELFIGNLNKEVTREEIEEVFDKYGQLVRCDVKNRGMGAAFCFLEFAEERDAEVFRKKIT
jgi:RNA recognition motif-containing protein